MFLPVFYRGMPNIMDSSQTPLNRNQPTLLFCSKYNITKYTFINQHRDDVRRKNEEFGYYQVR